MLEYLQAFDSCIRFVLNRTKCLNSCETWDLLLYNKPMKTTPYLSPLDFCCLCRWIPTWAYLDPHLAVLHLDLGPFGRSKNCSTKWITTTMAPWIVPGKPMDAGRRGVMGGSFGFFTRRWGKKSQFPMGTGRMKWTCVIFCSLAQGQLSNWIGKTGRCNGARHCRKHACLL